MKILLIFFCLTAMLSSCSKSSNPVVPTPLAPDSTRFPTHALFEQNGLPSLNGWVFHPQIPGDTANFDRDSPPNSGTWSIKLHKADTPHGTNNVTEEFTNLTGGIYELTSWLKTKYEGFAGTTATQGWISITKRSGGISYINTAFSGMDTVWHSVSLLDTLSLLPSDSVILELSAAATDTATHGNPMWFDNVTFQKIR